MRDGAQQGGARAPLAKGLRALALSFTTCCGLGVAGAYAQQPEYPQPVQQIAYQQDAPSAADLQAKLDQQQTKIDQWSAQLSGMQQAVNNAGHLQATPAAMET